MWATLLVPLTLNIRNIAIGSRGKVYVTISVSIQK